MHVAEPLCFVDRTLQRWRQAKASPWIRSHDRVLDIGCYRGEFLESLGDRIGKSVGIDPLAPALIRARYRLEPRELNGPLPFERGSFDAIVLLATLEHIVDKAPLIRECARLLSANGRVVITVPSPHVDRIVDVLRFLRVSRGMSMEQHHGFDPRETPGLFADAGFFPEHQSRFQLGLNYLFVFKRIRP